ncbi:hypothetical protein [Vagococcus zengguangii]|uniref:Uncharacterized protein n=1 Tax=Vagococcus zengguangii TaxID=2571750 RepID=A0A4D7CUS4_9ENTE|nr:hypothetical protein [Vagococcus zengguangii]QCI86071.1 hypothetical protein FA707_03455 [Vagococcus zengguangii]TLG80186.1 hypothetical protein FE258_05710 [Vagococcus zengguangii]
MPDYYLMTSLAEPKKEMFNPSVPTNCIRYEFPVEPHIRVSQTINGALVNNVALCRQASCLLSNDSLKVRLYIFETDPKETLYVYDTYDLIENDLSPDALMTNSLWLLNQSVPREIKELELSDFVFEKRYIFSNQLNKHYLGYIKDEKMKDTYQNYYDFFAQQVAGERYISEITFPISYHCQTISLERIERSNVLSEPVVLPQKVAKWVSLLKSRQCNVDDLFNLIEKIENEQERKILSDFALEQTEDLIKAYHEGFQILRINE